MEEYRFECLKLAAEGFRDDGIDAVMEAAERFVKFVTGGESQASPEHPSDA